jgi:hypothetical protein
VLSDLKPTTLSAICLIYGGGDDDDLLALLQDFGFTDEESNRVKILLRIKISKMRFWR